MSVSSVSSEYHERIQRMGEGLEGVQHFKDDIIVHGKGQEHDRIEDNGITLRREKCESGHQRLFGLG